jgi:hypothetical protein
MKIFYNSLDKTNNNRKLKQLITKFFRHFHPRFQNPVQNQTQKPFHFIFIKHQRERYTF